MELTKEHARKVLDVVDAGLVHGLGKPEPGKMCVEAAVCFALGLPHSDNPPCVGEAVRAAKITLNDSAWSSDEARAKGMRALAIAQLGSDQIDQNEFSRMLAEQTIRQIVPIALRAVAERIPKHKDALLGAADECEKRGDEKSARAAADAAYAAARAAAYAAARAADAAARAAYAAARAAADAADAAARAAADAAYAAARAAADRAAARAARDGVLIRFAGICTDILIKLGSQGSKWLDIL